MEYLEILRKDKVLSEIIAEPLKLKKKKSDLYFTLLRAVAGQQLSTKAADTIWKRFVALFPDEYPHASQILSLDNERIRAVGFSYQKANYLKNIAGYHIEHDLNSAKIKRMKDDKLKEFLTIIKGVGTWTVEMILMFSLNKTDIFPIDDLGIQNAMKMIYTIPETKKEMKIKMLEIAESWRPYRTYACLYLWRHKDNKPINNKL